jgi:hypothetical protein
MRRKALRPEGVNRVRVRTPFGPGAHAVQTRGGQFHGVKEQTGRTSDDVADRTKPITANSTVAFAPS